MNQGLYSSIIGVFMNIILFVIKFIVAKLFNSYAILADAMNNFSDVLSSLIALVGFKLGEKPADKEHPFGHERFEYISGFLMSMLMFYIGFDLLRESIANLFQQKAPVLDNLMIWVMFISIVVKGFLYFMYRKNYRDTKSDVILAAQQDSRNDVLISIVILLGFYLNQFYQWNIDGLLGSGIALFIMLSSVKLLKEFIDDLVGHRPKQSLINAVIESVIEEDDVFSYHDLLIHEYGDRTYYGTIHLEVDQRLSLIVAHEIAHRIETKVLNNTGVELVVHLDPIDVVSDEIKRIHLLVKSSLHQLDPAFKFHDLRLRDNLLEVDVVLTEDTSISPHKITQVIETAIGDAYSLSVTFDTVQLRRVLDSENEN